MFLRQYQRLMSVSASEECTGSTVDTMGAVDGAADSVLDAVQAINVGIGLVLTKHVIICYYELKKAHEKWEKGERSKYETKREAVKHVTTAITKSGLIIAGKVVGGVTGGCVGSSIPVVGPCIGSKMGAVIGAKCGDKLGKYIPMIGEKVGPVLGRQFAKLMPKLFTRDDRQAHCIENFKTVDHVITEDPKGIHALISHIDVSRKKITLLHSNTKAGVGTEETV